MQIFNEQIRSERKEMNAEFFEAIAMIEREKGIPREFMMEKIEQALIAAYRRTHESAEHVTVTCDENTKEIRMTLQKDVVPTEDDVMDSENEISLESAQAVTPGAQVGDRVSMEVDMRSFGRIAAQTAKQVIIQGIREAERGMIFREFNSKAQEILNCLVSRVDPMSGAAVLEVIGSSNSRNELRLFPGEQIPGERLHEGQRIKVYVVEVQQMSRGPQVMISRTHPGLVRRLFELEVPEIHDGLVEVMSVSREPGSRTKLAVRALEDGIDPIGACIGPRGARVGSVVEELAGEKIDIVLYNEDPTVYVAAALAPADVIQVTMEGEKSCRVIVPDDQLSLAIGKEGQNARLAARLTGCKIDIKPASSEA